MRGLSLLAASGGHSSSQDMPFTNTWNHIPEGEWSPHPKTLFGIVPGIQEPKMKWKLVGFKYEVNTKEAERRCSKPSVAIFG